MKTILKCCLWSMIILIIPRLSPADEHMFYRVVSSQQTHIIDLDHEGMLVWSNAVTNVACRIESLPSLTEITNGGTFTAEIVCPETTACVRMPLHPIPTPILLSIYSDGWGTLLETWAVSEGETIPIRIEEDFPYSDPAQYYAYAHRDNCYTELYAFTKGDSIVLDSDTVPEIPFSMTGVIFGQQSFFADCYLQTNTLSIEGPSGPLPDLITDEFGRYYITNVITGPYQLSFNRYGHPYSFELFNSPATDYQDLYFMEPYQAMAPNIYLYPETETHVQVTLEFPNQGHVTVSEPDYGEGWNVEVSTNGIIDGEYPYLFYEASIPHPLVADEGWLLDGNNLEAELRSLLVELGFLSREIDDFIDYWIPLMQGPRWYAVYRQQPAEVTTLSISPQPQSVLRAHFVFRPLEQPIAIPAPEVLPFARNGFTVVEWGVLGWEEQPAE